MTAQAVAAPPGTLGARCHYPLVGVAAVLVCAFIATLNTRITVFGLADIRGGLGLGFDEGSWLTSVFSAGQMLVAPTAAWLSTVVGARRCFLLSSTVFALSSLLLPFSGDYWTVITLQFIRGLSVGTFIPAALGFILRSMAPQWWIWGIAAYCFRFVFSQNVASSLEAFYSEQGLWQWIFWQNTALAPLLMLLIWFGMPKQAVDRELLRRTDWGGIVFVGLGLALIYAGLDQGNRLDWLNSGVVTGLILGGGLLVIAFFVNEAIVPFPLIHLRVAAQPNVWGPALLLTVYGFGSTATAFVLPDYLTRIQGLRALQIGDVLNWIALPQFVLVPLISLTLRHVDARLVLAVGFAVIAVGSWMDTGLTHDWAYGDFMPSQIVEAIGLAIGVTGIITFTVANITPPQAAAIAATLQIARLMGTELGSAFIQTFVRVREQFQSNQIGQHLGGGSDIVQNMIALISGHFSDTATSGDATSQAIDTIGAMTQKEAYVLAYIDAFWIVAWVLALSLLLILVLRPPPPNPLTPPRIVV
ncbi:MAG: MFS transporter [Alphaproteobacteria bacterium]|nr:MFS transporter [Alphaproteobacteria bacterium]